MQNVVSRRNMIQRKKEARQPFASLFCFFITFYIISKITQLRNLKIHAFKDILV